MATHEVTLNPSHLVFLKKFPNIASWLDCHGFTVMYSHRDESMGVAYTFWSDYTSESENTEDGDANDYLVVSYCEHCGTIEVYQRKVIAMPENEKELLADLDSMTASTTSQSCESVTEVDIFPRESLDLKIETLINERRSES